MITTANAAEFLVWNDSWLVGHPEIDKHHRHLVYLLNELHTSMRRGEGRNVIADTLDGLFRYTSVHFAYEESLMEQCSYPDLAYHKREHATLSVSVFEFQQRFLAGEIVVSVDLLEFLGGWLRNHILGTDRNFISFLQSDGGPGK